MLVVRVELHSAITHKITEIARMDICNTGGDESRGNYKVRSYRGRDKEALDKRTVTRKGEVTDYPRLALHVWHLVFEALKSMKYDRRSNDATDNDA